MGYIYKITNTINNKSYIGISIHEPEKDRIQKHLSGRGNRVIANAVKKYGKDAFTYEVLEANVFDEFLPELEVAYIANYNTVAPNGYNLTHGGEVAKTYSEQTRRKLSEAHKGRKPPNFGKSMSAAQKIKLSEAHKGKTLSAEHRRKISERNKGENNPFYGKTHTAESRRKNSEAHKGNAYAKGYKHTAESRRKNSEAQKGRKHTAQSRRKISEAQKGKKRPPFSAEHRRKISEAGKGRKHSPESRHKMSEARKGNQNRRLSEYAAIHKYFLSLSSDMPLQEKRNLLFAKFSNINKRTIYNWVRKWASPNSVSS